jgi:protein involved in polysaccharide export with SLBB domain
LVLVALACTVVAWRPAARAEEKPPGSDAVRVGDLLVITVPDLTGPAVDFVKPVRVDATGRVSLPYLKEPLPVEKLTLTEVERAVNDALRAAKVLDPPAAWVDRMERGGESASVQPGPIAPGDVLRFSLVDVHGPGVERVRHLHVSEAGNVGLPFLGQTKVAGMTEIEAEAAVLKAYRRRRSSSTRRSRSCG